MSERLRVSALAIVSALVFFFVATGLFNAELQAGTSGDIRDLTFIDVTALTLFSSALAIGLAAVLDRFRWGRTAWTIVAFVVLASSILTVFGLQLTTADLIWQTVLHGIFGLLLIIGFYVAWPDPDV